MRLKRSFGRIEETLMRVLVGILACEKDKWAINSVRRMWLLGIPYIWEYARHTVEFRFFVGTGCSTSEQNDEICLEADDRYQTLKVQAMFKWALKHGYDFVFKCDIDTYVRPRSLLQSGFEKHNWLGGYGSKETGPYGGSGYWLNREMMNQLQGDIDDARTSRPWDEDRWVGANLIYKGFSPELDNRYDSIGEPHNIREDFITSHLYARQGSYSGPVAPPPVLLSSNERLNLMQEYHQKFKEIG